MPSKTQQVHHIVGSLPGTLFRSASMPAPPYRMQSCRWDFFHQRLFDRRLLALYQLFSILSTQVYDKKQTGHF